MTVSMNEDGNAVTLSGFDLTQWRAWQANEEYSKRRRGAWWLGDEGREAIEETWGPESYNDGNCARPLYEKVLELESELGRTKVTLAAQVNEKLSVLEDLAQALRERDRLQNEAATKQPNSFTMRNWGCGHLAPGACRVCFEAKCEELDKNNTVIKEKNKKIQLLTCENEQYKLKLESVVNFLTVGPIE